MNKMASSVIYLNQATPNQTPINLPAPNSSSSSIKPIQARLSLQPNLMPPTSSTNSIQSYSNKPKTSDRVHSAGSVQNLQTPAATPLSKPTSASLNYDNNPKLTQQPIENSVVTIITKNIENLNEINNMCSRPTLPVIPQFKPNDLSNDKDIYVSNHKITIGQNHIKEPKVFDTAIKIKYNLKRFQQNTNFYKEKNNSSSASTSSSSARSTPSNSPLPSQQQNPQQQQSNESKKLPHSFTFSSFASGSESHSLNNEIVNNESIIDINSNDHKATTSPSLSPRSSIDLTKIQNTKTKKRVSFNDNLLQIHLIPTISYNNFLSIERYKYQLKNSASFNETQTNNEKVPQILENESSNTLNTNKIENEVNLAETNKIINTSESILNNEKLDDLEISQIDNRFNLKQPVDGKKTQNINLLTANSPNFRLIESNGNLIENDALELSRNEIFIGNLKALPKNTSKLNSYIQPLILGQRSHSTLSNSFFPNGKIHNNHHLMALRSSILSPSTVIDDTGLKLFGLKSIPISGSKQVLNVNSNKENLDEVNVSTMNPEKRVNSMPKSHSFSFSENAKFSNENNNNIDFQNYSIPINQDLAPQLKFLTNIRKIKTPHLITNSQATNIHSTNQINNNSNVSNKDQNKEALKLEDLTTKDLNNKMHYNCNEISTQPIIVTLQNSYSKQPSKIASTKYKFLKQDENQTESLYSNYSNRNINNQLVNSTTANAANSNLPSNEIIKINTNDLKFSNSYPPKSFNANTVNQLLALKDVNAYLTSQNKIKKYPVNKTQCGRERLEVNCTKVKAQANGDLSESMRRTHSALPLLRNSLRASPCSIMISNQNNTNQNGNNIENNRNSANSTNNFYNLSYKIIQPAIVANATRTKTSIYNQNGANPIAEKRVRGNSIEKTSF